jgi:hypothetical protein
MGLPSLSLESGSTLKVTMRAVSTGSVACTSVPRRLLSLLTLQDGTRRGAGAHCVL